MNFTSLLGDSVSKEVIDQLEEGMATTIKNAVYAKEQELTEQANAYSEYVQSELAEKADAYGVYIKESLAVESKESKETLEESFAEKEVSYIERIEEVKQAAEGYAELIFNDIVEKADAYTEHFVEEYQSKNTEMFESIQREQNAHDIVENITSTLAGFGFDVTQNTAIAQLKESVATKDAEISELNGKLYEDDVSKQKELVLEEMTEGLSLSEKQKVVDAASDILTESVGGFKNVVRILVNKYDSNDDRVETTTKKINERVNTDNNDEDVSFKDTFTNGQSVNDIANTLI